MSSDPNGTSVVGDTRTTLGREVQRASSLEVSSDQIVQAYRVDGKEMGPFLLVCGRGAICNPAFERIMELPSLPWLRGTLVLSYIGQVDVAGRSQLSPGANAAARCDATLFLDFMGDHEGARIAYADEAYWTILRKMTELGMIAGRGVPSK